MIQKVFKIHDDAQLAKVIADLKTDKSYQNAAQRLVMLYAAEWRKETLSQMIDNIRSGLPDATVVGVTQATGEIFGEERFNGKRYVYRGSTLNVLLFEQPSFTVCSFDLHKLPEWECARQLQEKIDQLGTVKGVQLYLSDTSIDVEDFYSLIYDTDSEYAYFGSIGGLTFSPAGEELNSYVFDETIYDHGIVAVVFY